MSVPWEPQKELAKQRGREQFCGWGYRTDTGGVNLGPYGVQNGVLYSTTKATWRSDRRATLVLFITLSRCVAHEWMEGDASAMWASPTGRG